MVLLVCSAMTAGCVASSMNGPYAVSIAPGLHPSRSADDAVRITRDYLDAQTPLIAAPQLHVAPTVTAVWAIRAAQAHLLDDCIPSQRSDQIVWVTRGQGDYLNLRDHPWSPIPPQAEQPDPTWLTCGGPGPAGTIVIDDATGQILGVYPSVPVYPHPTALPS